MKKYSKLVIALVVALVFISTFVFLWKKGQAKPVTYQQLTAEKRDISKTTVVTGKIEPRNEVNVKPQISGIITDIYKEPGQTVAEGEVIAKVKVIPDMGQLSSAESRVRLSAINLQQAETDFSRIDQLHQKNLVSNEEYEKAQQQLRQAKEEKLAAEDALQVVRDGVSKSNASASSTLIRSTITGVILDIPVKVGNSVINSNTFNDGTTIAIVANMQDLIFRGNVDETDVGQLKADMPMTISIGALQDLTLTAHLEYISPKATEVNGANQFEIKAAIALSDSDTKGATLRSGYSANAVIELDKVAGVVAVQESAIEFSADSTFVYVVKGKDKNTTYERTPVTTGLSDGIYIEVKSGLKSGTNVRGPQNIDTD